MKTEIASPSSTLRSCIAFWIVLREIWYSLWERSRGRMKRWSAMCDAMLRIDWRTQTCSTARENISPNMVGKREVYGRAEDIDERKKNIYGESSGSIRALVKTGVRRSLCVLRISF